MEGLCWATPAKQASLYIRQRDFYAFRQWQCGGVVVKTEKKAHCLVMVYCGLSARQEFSGE